MMGYYMRGDYYSRGDYYRGDVWSTLGKVGGAIVGGVKGFITGGLPGAAIGAASGFVGGGGGSTSPRPPGTQIGPISFPPGGGIATPFGNFGTLKPGAPGYGGSGTPGYHISRRTGKLVRNRHMNPLNVKALRRADRRARSFLHITKSVVRHYVAKHPKGRAYVHTRRRKRAS